MGDGMFSLDSVFLAKFDCMVLRIFCIVFDACSPVFAITSLLNAEDMNFLVAFVLGLERRL